jgi:hypothetical protein
MMKDLLPTVMPIFATPFAIVPTGGTEALNATLASLFLSRATEEYRDPRAARNPLCFCGREDLFEWPDEPTEELRRQMLGGICAAVMAVNRYTEAEFDALGLQARARFTIVRPNGCIPAASAPLASWFVVYCVAAPPPAPARADSAVLRLYAIREGTMFLDAANWRLRDPFNGSHHVWRPVPGQMAVFPASILHEVALNRTEANLLLVTARARFAHGGQVEAPPW